MNATCPAGSSYTFQSIIRGCDLLRAGLVWRIGDGMKVNIHHDQWIPWNGSLTLVGAELVPGLTKVRHLLDHSGLRWDEQKVDAMFSADDARDIKQIIVGGSGVDDCLAWNYTRNF